MTRAEAGGRSVLLLNPPALGIVRKPTHSKNSTEEKWAIVND